MLNKIRIALAMSGTLIAGAATVAMAHPAGGGPDKGEAMQKFDTNKDGKLDDKEREAMRAAFKAKRAEMIAKFDTNKDGKLDDAERKVMQEARAVEEFKKLDKDGNGVLSLDEFKAGEVGHQGRFGRGHRGHRGHEHGDKD